MRTNNGTIKTKAMRVRWGVGLLLAIGMAGAMSGPVRGQLPGLPQAQAPGGENGDQAGPAAAKPAVVMQSVPLRGSLFKQGAVAGVAAAAAGVGENGAGRHAAASFIAVEPAQPRRYRKNDIITVVIHEDSNSTTNGTGNSKKTQDFDLALEQFLQMGLSGSGVPTVGVVGSPNKLPEIKFKYNNDRQSDAEQQRQDSLTARISATVLDIKPNGTLVVEAVKHITVDKEEQTFKLSGTCRVEDITPDNTVLSTQLADLMLSKQTRGEVRDGTKRGWLNKFWDSISPF